MAPEVEINATQRKPFPPQPREQEVEDVSTESANTSHSSQDHTPENSHDGGIQDQAEETEDSQEGERTEAAPMEDSSPPPINIKDEPIDEGYDAALLPQSSIRQIKEELEHQEEELRISSVYSVGGGNTFASPTDDPLSAFMCLMDPVMLKHICDCTHISKPKVGILPSFPEKRRNCGVKRNCRENKTTKTCMVCQRGRGTLLQAMAQIPLRPPASVPTSLPSLISAPPRQPPPSVPGSVRCSGCSKVLLKGQTAFQRKGSTQLFCSTVCLTGHLPPANKNRLCFQCNREILQPRDMVTIPGDNNTLLNFCGQFCLAVFKNKKKQVDKVPEKQLEKKPERPPEKPAEPPSDIPFCAVCKVSKKIEHEVTHHGTLYRLCSDSCFVTWRKSRKLAMNCCEGCGLYCSSSSGSCQTLTVDKSQLNFCGPTCIGTYKQTCKKTVECVYCHKIAMVSSTIMERDQKGKVQLYCSSSCVELSAAFPCCECKVSAVPQYHLAMVDGTIRNFCSYDCVSIYRKSGNTSQPDLTNGTPALRDPKAGPSAGASSVPPLPQDHPSSVAFPGHHPSHTSVPPLEPPSQAPAKTPAVQPMKPAEGGPKDIFKLTCHQCSKDISMFCSETCCDQYKSQKNVLMPCEICKREKRLHDTLCYNQQDLFFCSDDCKSVFKHERMALCKDSCSYCSGFSTKMLHSHYGGRMEEFCRPHCMSQYTVLYYGMGRCDSCRKQGSMTEKLQCLGSVRNFCNLPCLLQYCQLHFETSYSSSNGTGTAPQTPYGTLPTTNIDGKNLDHASTQTDAMQGPSSRRRQMKNKSVLCRPFTMDQESMCLLLSPSAESAAVSIVAAALLDSSSQPDQTSAEASTSPSPSPKPQGETQPSDAVPARLTGRHFLGRREMDSDCKVCSQHKRKRVEEEEQQEEKKQKTEEDEGTERKTEIEPEEGVKDENNGENKEQEHSEVKLCEQEGGTLRRKTWYFCKTCSGEPSLCPVPCFELYHTRLVYKTAPGLEAQGVLPPSMSVSIGGENVRVLLVPVPVPVPVFIPVPMSMYSQYTPFPMAMPVPVPVPIVVAPQKKETRDAAVQSEPQAVTEEKPRDVSTADQRSPHSGDMESEVVAPMIREVEETEKTVQADLPLTVSSERSTESSDPQLSTQPEVTTTTSEPPTTSAELQPPSSPLMDLETDIPTESLDQKPAAPQRGVKRSRDPYCSRKRSRRRTGSLNHSAVRTPPASKLNHVYGVKAWRSWVQQQNQQPTRSDMVDVKEDVLQCDSAELSFALSHFITDVRRPNGETYSQTASSTSAWDTAENIFTDELYSQFTTKISGMLQLWKPKLLVPSVSSRVVESYLWECKQLGAYSPIVLLNTLLFFCTKNFGFTTLEQHQSVSFTNFTRLSKPCNKAGKKRQGEEEMLEMLENVANPLHCPPEEVVHTHSSLWYTCQPLEGATLQSMLSRILAVREVHQGHGAASAPADDDTLPLKGITGDPAPLFRQRLTGV
ncbi:hypothetical protein F7725_007713 [Dissostichus mawsoni]|uniref:TRASH domain-containing protein n=1 Tax=Dissostichus mawsoni TaxID=36200 RepID=A0A7J5Y590_DISMA|nr:hypothetical protein F7725_007713 [Dissostichus mawsoni]